MKIRIIPLLLVLVLLLSINSAARGQADDSTACAGIIAFLKAVYQSDLPVAEVAKQYVTLSKEKNELSTEKRYELISYHIQLLREGNSLSASSADKPLLEQVTVIPYRKLSKEQALLFEVRTKHLKHIYAALENGTVFRYFVYQNGKITSFDYMTKGIGGPRYFIGY